MLFIVIVFHEHLRLSHFAFWLKDWDYFVYCKKGLGVHRLISVLLGR